MLKIRLQRIWKIHNAVYRIVVAEHTSPIKWKFIEKLWSFAAQRKEATLNLNKERAVYWMSVWAQPSDSVARLLSKNWVKEAEKFIKKRVMKMSNVEKAKIEAKAKEKEEAAEKAKEAAEAKENEAEAVEEKIEEKTEEKKEEAAEEVAK